MNFHFVFLILLWSCFSFAKNCDQIHASASPTVFSKVFRQAQKLNPVRFHAEPQSTTELYLHLKSEEWVYAPIPLREVPHLRPVPLELAQHLQSEYSKNFDLAELSPTELSQFYVNALRGLYSRLVTDVKLEKVKASTAASFDGLETFAAAMADVLSFSKDLRDRDLAPEVAREWVQKGVTNFPWAQAFALVRTWKSETKSPFFIRREFYDWLAQRENLELNGGQVEKVVEALDREDLNSKPICCATACFNCPNNRARLHR